MYKIENGQVYRSYDQDGVTVTVYHDMQYHAEIEYDGTSLTIRTSDYLGADYLFNGVLPLVINGAEQSVVVVNGVATMPFATTGYDTIKTNKDGMRNGELIIGSPPVVPSEIDFLKQQVQQLTTTLGDLILDGGL